LDYCEGYEATPAIRCIAKPAARAVGPAVTRVTKQDTLDVALGLDNPLVLILADDERPGGCVLAGAGMQEESLFRRTALFRHLLPGQYPIGPAEALYAPRVPVLLSSEASGYAPLRPGTRMAFVACPGIKMPRLDSRGRMTDEDIDTLRTKIRLVLDVARAHGHTNLVLGALGCGVWGCPARQVADAFADVLQDHGAGLVAHFAVLGAAFNVFQSSLQPAGQSAGQPGRAKNPP
jgi:uncharacterized protein (TIGR02452 family)